MTAPALKVECAFDSGWSTAAASRTWTDVTTYVLGGAGVTHGRQDEFSTTNPNTLQLTLDNSDGRFTAGLATSPYYPNVKLARPVRVTVTPAGQSPVVRFVGYVDQWPVEWPGVVGSFATCALTASSRMALLGIGTELRSIVEEEILADSPAAYYTLGEPEDSTTAADSSGHSAATLVLAGSGVAPVFGTATGPGTDGLTAVQFAGGASGKRLSAVMSADIAVMECFFSCPSIPAGEATIIGGSNGTTVWALAIQSGTGQLAMLGGDGSSAVAVPNVADGETHHVLWNLVTGDLYIDGVLDPTGAIVSGLRTFHVGGTPAGTVLSFDRHNGAIAHAAVYTTSTITAAQILSHSDAGLTGFAGDVAVQRLLRYAGYAGIPAAECDFETGVVSDLAHIDTTGKTALQCMREVETTEGGVLFDAGDGDLQFHARDHRYAAASVLTVDVSAGELGPSYAPKRDTFGLLNDVTATNADGVTARVRDQDSVDAYGNYRQTVDLATTDPDEPFMRASWLTGSYAEEATRVATLTVELAKLTGARQAAVLAVGVGDRITVTNLMDQSDASTKEFYVEGYAEQVGGVGGVHQVVFNLSPAEVSDVWQLDSAIYSVLGSTTRLAY